MRRPATVMVAVLGLVFVAPPPAKAIIIRLGEAGISYRTGGAQKTAPWKDLAPGEVRRILLDLAPKTHEEAGIAMIFLGDRKAAREELSKAVKEGSPSAGRWLEEVDRSARAYSYDFSRWQQFEDWEVAGGRWSASHGVLVQSDDLDAKLKEFNPEWETKRGTGRLEVPECVELEPNAQTMLKECLVKKGKAREAQYKNLYLTRKKDVYEELKNMRKKPKGPEPSASG